MSGGPARGDKGLGISHGATGTVPWGTDAAWLAMQKALQARLAEPSAATGAARGHAVAIAHLRDLLADLFGQVAPDTCAICPDPCCRRAKVWLDLRDLLFIHLTHDTPPPGQLRRDLRGPCRYLGPQGCTLPPRLRPWICAWYICPALSRVLARDIPGGAAQVARWRARVTAGRKAMEAALRPAQGLVVG